MTVELHHRLEGPDGAPVVMFSNSLGTTLAMWDDQAAALADRYRVLRYDTAGTARSPVPPGPYTVDDLADDALALLDQLGIERVAFCGLSLGGAVGDDARAAGARADRAARALLARRCSSGRPSSGSSARRPCAPRASRRSRRPALERWLTPDGATRVGGAARRDAALAAAPRATPPAARRSPRYDLRGAARRRPRCRRWRSPAPTTPPRRPTSCEAIAAEIPGARLHVIGGARHIANVEQPGGVQPPC